MPLRWAQWCRASCVAGRRGFGWSVGSSFTAVGGRVDTCTSVGLEGYRCGIRRSFQDSIFSIRTKFTFDVSHIEFQIRFSVTKASPAMLSCTGTGTEEAENDNQQWLGLFSPKFIK